VLSLPRAHPHIFALCPTTSKQPIAKTAWPQLKSGVSATKKRRGHSLKAAYQQPKSGEVTAQKRHISSQKAAG
jgi:hypothetical protein